MDVKNTFLNEGLKETVNVRQPHGFLDNDKLGKVLRCTRHSTGFDNHHELGT